MMNAYKLFKNLSNVKLDKFFCEFELHKQTNLGHLKKSIALVAENSKSTKVNQSQKKSKVEYESKSEPNSEFDNEALSSEITNAMKKMMRKKRCTKEEPRRNI